MAYAVEFARPAERAFAKMDRTVVRRIRAELAALAEETRPDRYVKRLKGHRTPPFYSLRVGDYRVILQIHNDRLIIIVVEVGPRESVYQKL